MQRTCVGTGYSMVLIAPFQYCLKESEKCDSSGLISQQESLEVFLRRHV
jgi:hypothetical protein